MKNKKSMINYILLSHHKKEKKMDLNSSLENNKDLLRVGTEIYYCDCKNYMSYTVTKIDSKGFECLESETQELEYFFFSELQHGWDFK